MYIVSLCYFLVLFALIYIFLKVIFNNNAELSKKLIKLIVAVIGLTLFIVLRNFAVSNAEQKILLDAINVMVALVIYLDVDFSYDYNNAKPSKYFFKIYQICCNFFIIIFATNRFHNIAYDYSFSNDINFHKVSVVMKYPFYFFIAFVILSGLLHQYIVFKKTRIKLSYKTFAFVVVTITVLILFLLGLVFYETVQVKFNLLYLILIYNVFAFYLIANTFELNLNINKFKFNIIENMDMPILIVNQSGKILKFNECTKKIFHSLENNTIDNIYNIKEIQIEDATDFEILKRNFLVVFDKNGNELFYKMSATTMKNNNLNQHYLITLEDITNLKTIESDLYKLTTIDQLTNLYNRLQFRNLGEKLLIEKPLNKVIAIFILDVDFFKKINDTYGHLIGDEFLIAIGKTIQDTLQHDCIVARYGGEEFCGIIVADSIKDIYEILNNLKENIANTKVKVSKIGFKTLTVSIGYVVLNDEKNDDLDTLLRFADIALYRAKNNGRNRIESY